MLKSVGWSGAGGIFRKNACGILTPHRFYHRIIDL